MYIIAKLNSSDCTFFYLFCILGLVFRIDASKTTSEKFAGLINDAECGTKECNSKMKLLVVKDYPRLCLFATRDIDAGEEIRYDYGEDSNKLPWVMFYFIFLSL